MGLMQGTIITVALYILFKHKEVHELLINGQSSGFGCYVVLISGIVLNFIISVCVLLVELLFQKLYFQYHNPFSL